MPEGDARPAKDAGQMVDELADLQQATAELVRKLRAYGLDRWEAARHEAEEGSRGALGEGARIAEEMRKGVGEIERKVEHHVREHPLSWIGGVLGMIGFGLILGMILHRRD